MKLSAIIENDENVVMVPLVWLSREDRQYVIQMEYEVIPIPGYKETNGYRAFKIIGPYSNDLWWFQHFSIPIWEDWKLTALYAANIQISGSTNGIQMFDHLDDVEKIQALKYYWFDNALEYIEKYFQEHPDLLKRAKLVLKPTGVNTYFKELF